jgi:sarcosine oxidase subunit alpha
VVATKGKRLHTVHAIDGAGAKHRFSVDLLAMAGGWNPQVALAAHLGHKPAWRSDISAYAVGEMPVGLRAAGAADGIPGLGAVLASGHRAAVAVVEAMGGKTPKPCLRSPRIVPKRSARCGRAARAPARLSSIISMT